MKSQLTQKIATILVPTALMLGMVSPAFALDLNANAEVKIKTKTERTGTETVRQEKKDAAVTRASLEIKKREEDLNALLTRIAGMKKVSDATKTAISTSVANTIAELRSLQVKIEADVTAADLQKDMKSIANSARVYLLVAPQARILAAADRLGTVTDMITAVNTKLQARITAAETAGKDVSATVAIEAEITAKLADAKVQAAKAITAVSGLIPDNGDAAKLKANQAALKTARAALAIGEKDLNTAQKGIKKITQILKSVHPNRVGEGEKRNEVEKKSEDNSSTTTTNQ